MMELPKRHATSESSLRVRLYGQPAHVNASGAQRPSEIRKAQAGGTRATDGATDAMSIELEIGISARCQLRAVGSGRSAVGVISSSEPIFPRSIKVLEIKATVATAAAQASTWCQA